MITYLIKSIICSGLSLGVYYLFLEREKMHQFNRLYLLTAFVVSWIIPLITFKIQTPLITEKIQPVITSAIFINQHPPSDILMNTSVQQTPHNYLSIVLWAIYAIVTFILLIRFAINLYQLSKLIIKNPCEKHDGYSLVIVSDNMISFSFLGYIFPSIDDYENGTMNKEIFLHESAHVKEMHSLDILFMELMKVFLWLNPFVFLYKKGIQLNHEFIADDVVVKNNDTVNYQHLLLSKIMQTPISQLVSTSNYSITKKRFIMMTKKTEHIKAILLKLAVIPIFGIIIFGFSEKVTAKETTIHKENLPQLLFQDTTKAVKKFNSQKVVKNNEEIILPTKTVKDTTAFLPTKVIKDSDTFVSSRVIKAASSISSTDSYYILHANTVFSDSLKHQLVLFDTIINGKKYKLERIDGNIYAMPGGPKSIYFYGIGLKHIDK